MTAPAPCKSGHPAMYTRTYWDRERLREMKQCSLCQRERKHSHARFVAKVRAGK